MRNIYTLKQYIMNIDGKQIWTYEIKEYELHTELIEKIGKTHQSGIKPYIECYCPTRKNAEKWKLKLEKRDTLATDRELYDLKKHGLLTDYDWEYDEIKCVNYGTLKKNIRTIEA